MARPHDKTEKAKLPGNLMPGSPKDRCGVCGAQALKYEVVAGWLFGIGCHDTQGTEHRRLLAHIRQQLAGRRADARNLRARQQARWQRARPPVRIVRGGHPQ